MDIYLDVCGKDGASGKNGHGGARGFTGSRGGNGGNGWNGSSGQNGGRVALRITVEEKSKTILLVGSVLIPGTTGSSPYQNAMILGEIGNVLHLRAMGGKGGDAGHGGDGGDGGKGSNGRNATKYSTGGDGGPGGDGGNGGNGGDGGNGGNGGNISITVSEYDMDTLMLLHHKPNMEGGIRGKLGVRGCGGSGGTGGDGGASYCWTEYTTHHSTNSDGSSSSYTTSQSFSTRGGSPGRSGRGGYAGSSGNSGYSGSDGNFEIMIEGKSYKWRYNLVITKVNYFSTKEDDIIEPGCTVLLYPTYLNNGNCRTPLHQDIAVDVTNNKWVQRKQASKLSRGFSDSQTITHPITFLVTPVDEPTQGDPLRKEGLMDHIAIVSRIILPFRDILEQSTTFKIQYPVEMSPILSSSAISTGEEAPILIHIENFSTKAIGKATSTGRVLRLAVEIVSNGVDDVKRDDVIFINEKGSEMEEEMLFFEVPNFPAKSKKEFPFTLKFRSHVEVYSFAVVRVSLELGSIDNYHQYKSIQQRTIQIQFAESYSCPSNTSTLLVVNNRSAKQEVNSWKSIFTRIRKEVAVYNISLYRGLDMNFRRTNAKNLFDDLAGGTMIFLNNSCRDLDSDTEKSPFHDFTNLYPLQLIRQYDIRTLILGEQNVENTIFYPLPHLSVERDPAFHFKSLDQFLATGIDRVSYHVFQSKKTDGVFYSELKRENSADSVILKRKKKSVGSLRRECMTRPLLTELSSPELSLEAAHPFVNVSPATSLFKAAQVGGDFSRFLMKKRKDHHKIKKVSGWQRRFFVLRLRDKTLSWYEHATSKQPKGVIDLTKPFKIITKVEESEGNEKGQNSNSNSNSRIFRFQSDARSLDLKANKQHTLEEWIKHLGPLQSEKEGEGEGGEGKEEGKESIRSLVHISTSEENPTGIDDAFYGWVHKKTTLKEKKRFMVLRLQQMTLSLHSNKDFWSPTSMINAHVVKIVLGWEKPLKIHSDGQVEEGEEEDPLPILPAEKEIVTRFTLMTPWKHYYLNANIASQPNVEEWISRIQHIQRRYLEAKALLCSHRFMSTIPERHAVIPANEQLLFWKSPKMAPLNSRGKDLSKKLLSLFPCRRFMVVSDFNNSSKLKTGSIRPKHFLGTLKIFETFRAVDPGFIIHHLTDEQMHDSSVVLSNEILHYVLRSFPFAWRLQFLRDIANHTEDLQMENCLISSFLSDLVHEIVVLRRSTLSLTEHSLRYEMNFFNFFVQYNWTETSEKQPILEGTIPYDSKLENILLQIVGSLKAIIKTCSAISNLWTNNGTIVKLVQEKLSFLLKRVTRCHTKEEREIVRRKLKEIKKEQLKCFSKKKSSSVSLFEMRFPFHLLLQDKSPSLEVEMNEFGLKPNVYSQNDFECEIKKLDSNPGKFCIPVEQAYFCSSQEDRATMFEQLKFNHTTGKVGDISNLARKLKKQIDLKKA